MYQSVPASMYIRRCQRGAMLPPVPASMSVLGQRPPMPIRFVASEVFRVFAHMHARGVLYRDLKPENVLLDARAHVRLVDFRLALIGTDWSL